MKSVKHILEYGGVLVLDGFFNLIPRSSALKVGGQLGLLAAALIPKRSRLAMENLKAAFPHKSESDLRKIVQSLWKNIGKTAVEFVRMGDFKPQQYTQFIEFDGISHMEEALSKNKGIILVGLHMGNWEMLGGATALQFGRVVAIARPMKNPWVEKWVQKKRSYTSLKIMSHRQAVKGSLKSLREKKIVGILVDQNLYTGGTFVNFFGRPAATTTLPALLHSRTQAPVILTYAVRKGSKIKVTYESPIKFPKGPSHEEEIQTITQVISDQLERIIGKMPQEWFWIHNRWKRKPEGM